MKRSRVVKPRVNSNPSSSLERMKRARASVPAHAAKLRTISRRVSARVRRVNRVRMMMVARNATSSQIRDALDSLLSTFGGSVPRMLARLPMTMPLHTSEGRGEIRIAARFKYDRANPFGDVGVSDDDVSFAVVNESPTRCRNVLGGGAFTPAKWFMRAIVYRDCVILGLRVPRPPDNDELYEGSDTDGEVFSDDEGDDSVSTPSSSSESSSSSSSSSESESDDESLSDLTEENKVAVFTTGLDVLVARYRPTVAVAAVNAERHVTEKDLVRKFYAEVGRSSASLFGLKMTLKRLRDATGSTLGALQALDSQVFGDPKSIVNQFQGTVVYIPANFWVELNDRALKGRIGTTMFDLFLLHYPQLRDAPTHHVKGASVCPHHLDVRIFTYEDYFVVFKGCHAIDERPDASTCRVEKDDDDDEGPKDGEFVSPWINIEFTP